MQAFLGEFIGTTVLILFGTGVVAGVSLKGSYAKDGGWVVIVLAWAIAVSMGVYTAGKLSDAHLNPAVTLGLWAAGKFDANLIPAYLGGQFAGAMLGALLTYLHYYPHWQATADANTKLGVFCTSPAIPHTAANLFSEFLGAFVLLFGLSALGSDFASGLKPLVVGALVAAIGFALGGTTGWAINPARDLGPRIMHAILPISGKRDANWAYAWVPVVGPILGGICGALAYQFIAG